MRGESPGLAGGLPEVDSYRSRPQNSLLVNRSKSHEKGGRHGRRTQHGAHEMGMQVPRRVHPQVQEEGAVRGTAQAPGPGVPRIGEAEGEQDRRGTPAAGPRAYADLDPAEVFGGAGDGYIKGKSAIHIARTYLGKKQNF